MYNGQSVEAEYDKSRNGYTIFRPETIILEGAEDLQNPDSHLTEEQLEAMVKLQASHEEGFGGFRNELIEHYDIYRTKNKGKVPWLR